jgi:hypothetical protein
MQLGLKQKLSYQLQHSARFVSNGGLALLRGQKFLEVFPSLFATAGYRLHHFTEDPDREPISVTFNESGYFLALLGFVPGFIEGCAMIMFWKKHQIPPA